MTLARAPRTDPEFIAAGNKVFLPVEVFDITCAVVTVQRCFGMCERAFVEIRRENLNGPVLEQGTCFLQVPHTQGIRLLSGGATCTPDAHTALRKSGLCFKNVRNHDTPQRIQLRLIAKEASLSDSDLVEQIGQFLLPDRVAGEAIQVLAKGFHLDLRHTAHAAVFQKLEFVVRMKNSGHLINEFADSHQVWFGCRTRSRLQHRCESHTECLSVR